MQYKKSDIEQNMTIPVARKHQLNDEYRTGNVGSTRMDSYCIILFSQKSRWAARYATTSQITHQQQSIS